MNEENNTSESELQKPGLNVKPIEPEEPLAFFRFNQASLKEVVEDLQDGYYETNLRGDLIAFNRALCRIHGYPPETMANMNFRDYTPPELHDEIFRTYHKVYKTGQPVQILDFKVTRPDGSVCIIHTSVHLVHNSEGKPTGFRGISRDVTEQKRNEAYENTRTQILEMIARNEALVKIMEAVLASLQEQMPDFAGMIFQENQGYLQCLASINLPESCAPLMGDDIIGPDGTIFGRAAFSRMPIFIDSVENDKRCEKYRHELLKNGIRALWVYPIIAKEESALGVLAACAGSEKTPLEREAGWLQSATATAEIAFEHHRMTNELSYLSRHDTLTGLLNRRSFMVESRRMFSLAERKAWTSAMLFLDLDGFKHVNDTWGHQIGDLLLVTAGQRLSECLRQSDCLGRMGGDEFAVFVPEVNTESVQVIANRISRAICQPFDLNGMIVSVGVSIGIALSSEDEEISVDNLLIQADSAMYHAKDQGIGWAFYKPEHQKIAGKKARMESMLRRSMANNELLVHYQPVRDLKTGQWVGAEALVRWDHPERGIVAAAEFLPLAESRGLICEIDRYVLPRALKQTRDWRGWISVNVSPVSLCRSDWVSFVSDSLKSQDFPPERLILEVTERVLLDMERAAAPLEELCRMGVRIALDDFGRGYSSLSYLSRLSVHCLKIDQGLIKALKDNTRNTTLVEMLLALSKKLGVDAVAEGVETSEELEWLIQNNCGLAQGYFLAYPAAWETLNLNG
ncbi:MAG: EAL domain-containing protein [Desulfobacteraceae bacterium]|nr:EAL domain-containing protein [Desulfobacteraceae bacterium]